MPIIEISLDDPMEMLLAVRENIYETTKDMNKEQYGRFLHEQCQSGLRRMDQLEAIPVAEPLLVETDPETDPLLLIWNIRKKLHEQDQKNREQK